MISFLKKYKNFGLLEFLVVFSFFYVASTLIWTASTISAVEDKANIVKSNHKKIVEFINNEINKCGQSNDKTKTNWGDSCNDEWSSEKIILYINDNMKIINPYSSSSEIIKLAQDPRIQAEGKAGQSTEIGVIFVSFERRCRKLSV